MPFSAFHFDIEHLFDSLESFLELVFILKIEVFLFSFELIFFPFLIDHFFESVFFELHELNVHFDLLDGVGLGAFGDFFGVVLALEGFAVEHFFGFEHDLVGLLCFFIIFEGEFDIFEKLLDFVIVFHGGAILGFELLILLFQVLNNLFFLMVFFSQGYQVLMHFDGFDCDGFLVFITVVLESLLFSDELLGVGLLFGVVLGELVLFLVQFLLVLVQAVGDEVGGRG